MPPTERASSVADILDRAADLIEPEGAWTQGEYARGASGRPVKLVANAKCFCALGAINAAAGHTRTGDDFGPAIGVVLELLEDENGGDGLDVCEYNDAKGRTQAEVVSTLREAAALAKARGQ